MTTVLLQSSGPTNLMVPEHAVPSILFYLHQPKSNQPGPTSFYQPISIVISYSQHNLCISGNSLWRASPHSSSPRPQNERLPLPTSQQAASFLQHLHHVANLLHNSTSLTISLASLRHFYLPNVHFPQNSKLLLSCFL